MFNEKNINPNLYRTFVVVAESKSFADAAEKMNTTEKVISNDINSLETQLGVQLFYRKHKGSNNGLRITEIGKEIYPQAKKVISSCDFIPLMIDSRNSLENARLSIGCPSHITVFFLMDKLIKLTQDYPNVEIKLDTESSSKKMIEKLKNNEIDFVILDSVPEEYLEELGINKIKDIENVFVSKDKIEIKDIKDLENYRYILSYDNRNSTKRLLQVLKQYDLNLNTILKCPTTEQRVDAAKGGIGIAYVLKEAVKYELETKQLYEINLPIELPMSSISIVYIKDQLTKVDKSFINEYLKK